MRKKHILYPLLALLLGVVGAFFYHKLLSGAVDGLPVPGDPAATVLLALCIVAGIVFLLLALRSKGMQGGALYAEPCIIRAAFLAIGAVLMLLSAALHLMAVMEAYTMGGPILSYLLEGILVLLSIPSIVSMVFLAKDAKEGTGRSHDSLTVLFPVLYCWFWLIDIYRHHSANPVLLDYIFLMLAVVFLLLAAFARSGFSFGDGKPRFTVFVCLCAIFLAPISLVSFFGLPTMLVIVGMTLYTAATLTALLRNLPMPEFPAPESELETEVSDDE